MKIFDLHCDTIMRFYEGKHLRDMDNTHISLGKLKTGQCYAQCFAIYVPSHDSAVRHGITDTPEEYFDKAYARYIEELELNQDEILPAYSMEDVEKNWDLGKMSSILTVEDGVTIDGKLEMIDEYYRRGIRMVSLTWNHENSLGYAWALLSALPQLGVKGEKLPTIDGTPPNLFNKIQGDAFAPRNKKALAIDFLEEPPYFDVSPTHKAKTWYLDPRAPKLEQPNSIQRLAQMYTKDCNVPEFSTEGSQTIDYSKREKLIEVRNLSVTFGKKRKAFKAVNNVSFDIYQGETFSLVGESGSGKTTIGRAILRINPTSGGDILYRGRKINGKISKELDKEVIQNCQMIFQDPMASLNERAKVDYIVSEGIRNFHMYKDEAECNEKVQLALREVGLLPEFASRFPHEFSGGQRQRIGIARALIMEPEFIVADEPISALDVSIRAQVLNLLNDLKKKRNFTYLFIAHDLSVVRFISDRIAVIYKGNIVELAEAEELFQHPLHPYTRALLSAVPSPDPHIEKKKQLLVYDPSVHDYRVDKPYWCEINPGHYVWGNQAELDAYQLQFQ